MVSPSIPSGKSTSRRVMVTERLAGVGRVVQVVPLVREVAGQAEHAVRAAGPVGVEPRDHLAAVAVVVQGRVVDA